MADPGQLSLKRVARKGQAAHRDWAGARRQARAAQARAGPALRAVQCRLAGRTRPADRVRWEARLPRVAPKRRAAHLPWAEPLQPVVRLERAGQVQRAGRAQLAGRAQPAEPQQRAELPHREAPRQRAERARPVEQPRRAEQPQRAVRSPRAEPLQPAESLEAVAVRATSLRSRPMPRNR